MTNFENIQFKNIDELARWLDEHTYFDNSPWCKWWDKSYCSKCETVVAEASPTYWTNDFAWCELNGKCRYFQEMDEEPSSEEIIKMWLESEYE